MAYQVELTDTFAGEANYSWVKRATVHMPPPELDNVYTTAATIAQRKRMYRQTLMRRAKAAVGMTGVRGRTERMGDGYEFRPYGMCMVLFVNWLDADTPTA